MFRDSYFEYFDENEDMQNLMNQGCFASQLSNRFMHLEPELYAIYQSLVLVDSYRLEQDITILDELIE